MNIKVIETLYHGIRFRSRLEARWAVFFDGLDIKYLYEPEGYNLNNIYYLPDFWSYTLNAYIEVKGILNKKDSLKCYLLCEHLQTEVIILGELPMFTNDGYYSASPVLSWLMPVDKNADIDDRIPHPVHDLICGEETKDQLPGFYECRGCGHIKLESSHAGGGCICGHESYGCLSKKIVDAFAIARQYRFEH